MGWRSNSHMLGVCHWCRWFMHLNDFTLNGYGYKHKRCLSLTVYVQLCHLVSVSGTFVVGQTHHPFSPDNTTYERIAVVAQPAI